MRGLVVTLGDGAMSGSGSGSAGRGRVLVIDDEPETVELLTDILADAGYDVVGALNGGEGLMLQEIERPDVVLLDLLMPEFPGFDVLRRVRAERPALPVIVVSGQGDLALAQATLACGAVRYIPKPFDPDLLLDAVETALTTRPAE